MTPDKVAMLFFDVAQIYATKAHETLDQTDFAHAKRYRVGAETILNLLRKQNESMATSIHSTTPLDQTND